MPIYRFGTKRELFLLVALLLLLPFSLTLPRGSTETKPAQLYVPPIEIPAKDPEEAAKWTLDHIKHAWVYNRAPDSEDNVTLLLEKVRERGVAYSYCYGIVLVWAYILHHNNISKPYVLIVNTSEPNTYHAIGVTFYNGKIHVFYAQSENTTLVFWQDPYPEQDGFNVPKFIKATGILLTKPGYGAFSLEDYSMALSSKDPVWVCPSVVKAPSGVATIECRKVKIQEQIPSPFTVIVKPEDAYLVEEPKNRYFPTQVFTVKFKDFAVIHAGDWTTIACRG